MPSGNGTWVPLHRPHGPCSPAPSPSTPSLVEMLRWDELRTEYIRRKATAGGEDVLDPAKPHVQMTQVDYKLQASFGIGTGGGSSTGSRVSLPSRHLSVVLLLSYVRLQINSGVIH